MEDTERDQLLIDAAREMEARRQETFAIALTVSQAIGLLATLQLAHRHPRFNGPTQQTMYQLALVIQSQLELCGPATKKLCAYGWDPDEDVG
jgi:hypothetical protein